MRGGGYPLLLPYQQLRSRGSCNYDTLLNELSLQIHRNVAADSKDLVDSSLLMPLAAFPWLSWPKYCNYKLVMETLNLEKPLKITKRLFQMHQCRDISHIYFDSSLSPNDIQESCTRFDWNHNCICLNLEILLIFCIFALPSSAASYGLYGNTPCGVCSYQKAEESCFDFILKGKMSLCLPAQWVPTGNEQNLSVNTRCTNLDFKGVGGVGAQLADVHSGFL